jgi:Tfp pilus assembly protein PilF
LSGILPGKEVTLLSRCCLFLVFLLFATACAAPSGMKKGTQAEVHYILGLSYLQEQNPTRALKEFLLAEEYDARDHRIQAALGQAYQLRKAYPQAEVHYLRAVRLDRNNSQYKNNLGALYLDMQRWDDAIVYFRQAAEDLLFTTPEMALTGLGFAHFNKGDHAAAIAAYRRALDYRPRFAMARLHLGETYFAQGEMSQAIAEYLQALTVAPEFVQAHYNLGLAYLRVHETAKARASFATANRLAPDSEFGRLSANYFESLK